ncbi:MAG: TonB family protein [Bacteroidota bacterium]
MRPEDRKGLLATVAFHVVLLAVLFVSTYTVTIPQLGFVEVDFGPIQEARPAQQASVPTPEPPQPEPQAETTPATATQPVDLPETPPEPDPDVIATPETEQRDPEPQGEAAADEREPRPETPDAPETTGGNPDADAGQTSDQDGTGSADRTTSPFSLEGLDRSPVATPLPPNPGARGTVAIRVTVDPSGRVVQALPARRGGDPRLDRAALQALRSWRFDALPPDVPQELQSGVVTFVFRLD